MNLCYGEISKQKKTYLRVLYHKSFPFAREFVIFLKKITGDMRWQISRFVSRETFA